MHHQYSTKTPHCGCPMEDPYRDCPRCQGPSQLEVRILYPPTKCVKQPCGFYIPPVPCHGGIKRKPIKEHTYDLTVQEPGPNDSYGLNGLNWWDWRMDEINRKAFKPSVFTINTDIPVHPLLFRAKIPREFPNIQCTLPIECYSRSPEPASSTPFRQPVTYSRDWRCCSCLPPSQWKPPHATWATNRHL